VDATATSGRAATTPAEVADAIPLTSAGEDMVLSEAEGALSEAESPPGRDELIEPGRALALADFSPPSLGAGERLLRLAYRLGVPGSMLTSPIAKAAKPRLLATVSNPLPGHRAAGTALRAGHFLVHGAKTPIAQIDFAGAARMTPPLDASCTVSPGSPISRLAPRVSRARRWPSGSSLPGSTPMPSRPRGRARDRPGPWPTPARAN
jgi:hypothetical protein